MLGLVCHFIEEKKKKSGDVEYFNKFEAKTLQLGAYNRGKYTNELIKNTYLHNVQKTLDVMPLVVKSGIRLFRLSSNLFPLYDVVSDECWNNDEVKTALQKLGRFMVDNDIRVTVHPGQFCVLSSDSDDVVAKSFQELSVHAWLFDEMGLERSAKYAINIHGGKSNRSSRLIDQIKSLPDSIRLRLTLENDETSYNVIDLLEIYQQTGTPVVFDSHHFTFNTGDLSMEDAFNASLETWPKNIKPLQHLSNTDPKLVNGNFMDRRKHSDMIHYVPDPQLQALRDDTIDVEVEAKLKNVSIEDMKRKFSINK